MKKNVLPFLALAALPAVALAILALFGARAEVGVVMTGSGPNVLLGAAWIACWLATLVVSPIALGAAAISRLVASRVSAVVAGPDPGGPLSRNGEDPSPSPRGAASWQTGAIVKDLHHLARGGAPPRWPRIAAEKQS